MRPSPWKPRTPTHNVARDMLGGFPTDALLSEVREHAGRGKRVRVRRPGFRSYDILQNGSAFMVLPIIGDLPPIGTYSNVCAALMAGDAYVEAVRRGEYDAEDDDGFPRGAA